MENVNIIGCVGGPIAYYAEGEEFEDTEGSGPGDGSGSGSTLTSRYCGSEAYWQLPPGQLRNLVNSVGLADSRLLSTLLRCLAIVGAVDIQAHDSASLSY